MLSLIFKIFTYYCWFVDYSIQVANVTFVNLFSQTHVSPKQWAYSLCWHCVTIYLQLKKILCKLQKWWLHFQINALIHCIRIAWAATKIGDLQWVNTSGAVTCDVDHILVSNQIGFYVTRLDCWSWNLRLHWIKQKAIQTDSVNTDSPHEKILIFFLLGDSHQLIRTWG